MASVQPIDAYFESARLARSNTYSNTTHTAMNSNVIWKDLIPSTTTAKGDKGNNSCADVAISPDGAICIAACGNKVEYT